MYIGQQARANPEKVAITMWPSGRSTTIGELYERSTRLGNLFRSIGLVPGDRVAIVAYNHLRYFEAVWDALDTGLYVVPVNAHCTSPEAAHVVTDSGAQVVIVSDPTCGIGEALVPDTPNVRLRLSLDATSGSYLALDEAIAGQPSYPVGRELRGTYMFYSSGTTGQPKGIKPPLPNDPAEVGDALEPSLPRGEDGKLRKKPLRDRYWSGQPA